MSYQQALYNFVVAKDGLTGKITTEAYPEGGEGRTVRFTGVAGSPDINGDNAVNALDLEVVFSNWGLSDRAGDVDGEGVIAGGDLAAWTV